MIEIQWALLVCKSKEFFKVIYAAVVEVDSKEEDHILED